MSDTSTLNANTASQWVSATDFADALVKARHEALEEAELVALQQRCERNTPWDTACLVIARRIRALKDEKDG
jgi:hypothetical protein